MPTSSRKHTEKSPENGRRKFLRHLGRQGLWALTLISISLLGGTVGFHVFNRMQWIDAFLNTAMLLGGMGPVGDMGPTAGKLFAAFFSLYSGVVFLVVAGLLLTPVLHRGLQVFHLEDKARN